MEDGFRSLGRAPCVLLDLLELKVRTFWAPFAAGPEEGRERRVGGILVVVGFGFASGWVGGLLVRWVVGERL